MGCSSSTSSMRGARSAMTLCNARIEAWPGCTVNPVLDVRVYRAAFVPALVAVFIAAFSLADRPAPATSPLAADAFDSGAAFGDEARPQRTSLTELARTFPSRAPGSVGDDGLAARVASTFGLKDKNTGRAAFQVTRDTVSTGGQDLQ